MSDDIDIQNTEDSADGQMSELTTLYAPRPLTYNEFHKIIISEYIDLLDEAEFAETFGCEKTSENIDGLVQGKIKLPKSAIKAMENSMNATIKAMQNFVLEGKAESAWPMAERLSHFSQQDMQYIAYKEGNTLNLHPYVRLRFSNIPEMLWTLDFIENVEKANEISSSNTSGINMKNAEKIYNALRQYEPNLDAEQKSSIYFLSSELFRRAQIVPGTYSEPKPCRKEIYCLKMVLENTSTPSLIDCCLDRMSSVNSLLTENIPLFITAYKRALSGKMTLFPEDSYRLNSQIAQLYLKDSERRPIGFVSSADNSAVNLHWAEYFYHQAYKSAPDNNNKIAALKAMGQIQNRLGNGDKAIEHFVQAAKLLPAPEKYEKLIETANTDHNSVKALRLIRQTISQLKKDKLPAEMKNILFQKALTIVRHKYDDEKVISSVERLMTNTVLTPNKKIVRKSSTRE